MKIIFYKFLHTTGGLLKKENWLKQRKCYTASTLCGLCLILGLTMATGHQDS